MNSVDRSLEVPSTLSRSAPVRRPLVWEAWPTAALWILPLIGAILAAFNAWKPYSLWFDEIASVTFAQYPLIQMFRWIITDVRPPLYESTLWVWIRLFGSSEPALRTLSLLYAMSVLVYLGVWSRRLGAVASVGTLAFFATCWLFPYFAQEVRSYALLLLLSTILVTQFVEYSGHQDQLWKLVLISFLTSWTHYYGLLMACVVWAWLFADAIAARRRLLLVGFGGLLLAAWPLFHFLVGKVSPVLWLQLEGPLSTFQTALRAVLPVGPIIRHPEIVLMCAPPIALLWRLLLNDRIRAAYRMRREYPIKLLYLFSAVIAAAAVLDMLTPASTPRNFIVLLPVTALALGLLVEIVAQDLWTYRLAVLGTFVWGAASLYLSYGSVNDYGTMRERWAPIQNWKASAQYLVEHTGPEFHRYYVMPYDFSSPFQDAMFNFYVDQYSHGTMRLEPIGVGDLSHIKSPFAIFLGQTADEQIAKVLAGIGSQRRVNVFYPPQGKVHGTGVILSVQ